MTIPLNDKREWISFYQQILESPFINFKESLDCLSWSSFCLDYSTLLYIQRNYVTTLLESTNINIDVNEIKLHFSSYHLTL